MVPLLEKNLLPISLPVYRRSSNPLFSCLPVFRNTATPRQRSFGRYTGLRDTALVCTKGYLRSRLERRSRRWRGETICHDTDLFACDRPAAQMGGVFRAAHPALRVEISKPIFLPSLSCDGIPSSGLRDRICRQHAECSGIP